MSHREAGSGGKRPAKKRSKRREAVTAAAGTVAAGLIIAWLTPIPGYVHSAFASHRKQVPNSPPVTVAIQRDGSPCGTEWMVNKAKSAVPRPPSSANSDWIPWADKVGAASVDFTHVTATIQAAPGHAVFITGIQFIVSKRQPPMRGTLVDMPCGGPVQPPDLL
jgi:hypothetical protein